MGKEDKMLCRDEIVDALRDAANDTFDEVVFRGDLLDKYNSREDDDAREALYVIVDEMCKHAADEFKNAMCGVMDDYLKDDPDGLVRDFIELLNA